MNFIIIAVVSKALTLLVQILYTIICTYARRCPNNTLNLTPNPNLINPNPTNQKRTALLYTCSYYQHVLSLVPRPKWSANKTNMHVHNQVYSLVPRPHPQGERVWLHKSDFLG